MKLWYLIVSSLLGAAMMMLVVIGLTAAIDGFKSTLDELHEATASQKNEQFRFQDPLPETVHPVECAIRQVKGCYFLEYQLSDFTIVGTPIGKCDAE